MKGQRALVTSAIVVAGIRLWMQLRGKTKTSLSEWAIGWGVTFFFLSMLSDAFPQGAGALASMIAVGDFLANGTTLFTDISSVVTGSEKGSSLFVSNPFGGSTPTASADTGTSSSSTSSGSSSGTQGPLSGSGSPRGVNQPTSSTPTVNSLFPNAGGLTAGDVNGESTPGVPIFPPGSPLGLG